MAKADLDKARGERIKFVRTGVLRLRSQAAFAKFLGNVTRGAVGNWERGGDIGLDNLSTVATKANVPFDWLAFGTGPEPGSQPTTEGDLRARIMSMYRQLPEADRKQFLADVLGLGALGRSEPPPQARSGSDD